jgi:hypothetical protein
VFDTHSFIKALYPHLGLFLPSETPTEDALLPAISVTLIPNLKEEKKGSKMNGDKRKKISERNEEKEQKATKKRRRERIRFGEEEKREDLCYLRKFFIMF